MIVLRNGSALVLSALQVWLFKHITIHQAVKIVIFFSFSASRQDAEAQEKSYYWKGVQILWEEWLKNNTKNLTIHSRLTWKTFFTGMKCNRGEGTEILQISANVVSLSYIHESY